VCSRIVRVDPSADLAAQIHFVSASRRHSPSEGKKANGRQPPLTGRRDSYLVGSPHHRGIHSTFSNFEVSYGNASTPDTLDFIVWAVCRFDRDGFVKASEQLAANRPAQITGRQTSIVPVISRDLRVSRSISVSPRRGVRSGLRPYHLLGRERFDGL